MQHIYSFSNYGGKHMKKITEKRAIELINMGLFPKCEGKASGIIRLRQSILISNEITAENQLILKEQ